MSLGLADSTSMSLEFISNRQCSANQRVLPRHTTQYIFINAQSLPKNIIIVALHWHSLKCQSRTFIDHISSLAESSECMRYSRCKAPWHDLCFICKCSSVKDTNCAKASPTTTTSVHHQENSEDAAASVYIWESSTLVSSVLHSVDIDNKWSTWLVKHDSSSENREQVLQFSDTWSVAECDGQAIIYNECNLLVHYFC